MIYKVKIIGNKGRKTYYLNAENLTNTMDANSTTCRQQAVARYESLGGTVYKYATTISPYSWSFLQWLVDRQPVKGDEIEPPEIVPTKPLTSMEKAITNL